MLTINETITKQAVVDKREFFYQGKIFCDESFERE